MKRVHIFVWVAIVSLSITGFFAKSALDRHITKREEVDIRYLPAPQAASFMAFGFQPAVSDIYWIEAINYFGEQLTNKRRSYKYLKSYTDLIVALDPLFVAFYDWSGTAFLYNGMPITREGLITSTRYSNEGIRTLNDYFRYDRNTIVKAAFNYAVESTARKPSIAYFELAARSFPADRSMLLVASTYAHIVDDPLLSSALKLEYLGEIAFEAQEKSEINYALHVLSSPRMNVEASQFVRALRVRMESDEDTRKLVENRLKENPMKQLSEKADSTMPADPRFENILAIDFSRTWMPADMLALFSL